jgi:hypothetical protein
MMQGRVETAVRQHVHPGARFQTPTGRGTFVVDELRPDGLTLLLGPKRTSTLLRWGDLEGISAFLHERGEVCVGANRDLVGDPMTLDGYLKTCVKRQVANYVAVVLEHAGLVELDRDRPARIKLRLT